MKKIKRMKVKKLGEGLKLQVRKEHGVDLGTTEEPLTCQARLALFYGMAEALNIPKVLDEEIRVKCRAAGYPESEHIGLNFKRGQKVPQNIASILLVSPSDCYFRINSALKLKF